MTELTRRSMLGGAAAVGATALTQAPAQAAAPPAGKQSPGVYRYKVGTHEVTVATDGARSFPLTESYVTNAPIAEVRKALEAAYLPPDRGIHHYAPIVVNTGSKLVLIDTGFGPATYVESKGELGQLQTNLAAAGIEPKAIDMVVISHFHGDHVNGLLDASGKLAYPNAEVLVPAAEWKFWMDDGEMSRAPAGRMADLFKGNRRVFDALGRKVTQYDWNKDIVPGLCRSRRSVTASATLPCCPRVRASLHPTDVTNNPDLFARNPGWAANSIRPATRRGDAAQGLRHAGRDKMPVQLPPSVPGLAHVEKADAGYRVVLMPDPGYLSQCQY